MMLSAADFDDLFPPRLESSADHARRAPPSPSQACIARWEDDGGRACQRPEPRQTGDGIYVRGPAFSGYRMADPRAFGIAFAIMPAIAAHGAASALLAAVSGLTRS